MVKFLRCLRCFLKNLHGWQEFYTTAGRTGRAKYQLCNVGPIWTQSLRKTFLWSSRSSSLLSRQPHQRQVWFCSQIALWSDPLQLYDHLKLITQVCYLLVEKEDCSQLNSGLHLLSQVPRKSIKIHKNYCMSTLFWETLLTFQPNVFWVTLPTGIYIIHLTHSTASFETWCLTSSFIIIAIHHRYDISSAPNNF